MAKICQIPSFYSLKRWPDFLKGSCNACRFLYVIQFYIANGFYVAIDFHGGQGQIETDRQIVANQTIFAANWLSLLTSIQSLPTYNQYLKGISLLRFLHLLPNPTPIHNRYLCIPSPLPPPLPPPLPTTNPPTTRAVLP
jgi:hypothetical protein